MKGSPVVTPMESVTLTPDEAPVTGAAPGVVIQGNGFRSLRPLGHSPRAVGGSTTRWGRGGKDTSPFLLRPGPSTDRQSPTPEGRPTRPGAHPVYGSDR